MESLDWITLDDLVFDTIVGILPREQIAAQPVEMSVKMGLSVEACGATGDLSLSVNYAAVAEQLRFIAQHGRWRLIESFVLAGARAILSPPTATEARAQVQVVELSMRKPNILDGVATPGVRIQRSSSWCDLKSRTLCDGATLEQLEANRHEAAYRLVLAPGASVELPDGLALLRVSGDVVPSSNAVVVGDHIGRCAGTVATRNGATLLAVGAPW